MHTAAVSDKSSIIESNNLPFCGSADVDDEYYMIREKFVHVCADEFVYGPHSTLRWIVGRTTLEKRTTSSGAHRVRVPNLALVSISTDENYTSECAAGVIWLWEIEDAPTHSHARIGGMWSCIWYQGFSRGLEPEANCIRRANLSNSWFSNAIR